MELKSTRRVVAQGKDGHRKRHGLAAYTKLDLAPVKLALLTRLVVLLDEQIRGDRYLSHSSRHTQVPVPATITAGK